MYSFTKEQIESIQSKALNYLGQPMKYKELCEKLDVPYIRQTKLKNNQKLAKQCKASICKELARKLYELLSINTLNDFKNFHKIELMMLHLSHQFDSFLISYKSLGWYPK